MKKILSIILLILFSSNISFAATREGVRKLREEKAAELAIKKEALERRIEFLKEKKEWLEDKTVNDLLQSGFVFISKVLVTTTDDTVQYHLVQHNDDYSKTIFVICFVDVKKTTCRLP